MTDSSSRPGGRAVGGLISRMIVACVLLILIVGATFATLLVAIDRQRETDELAARSMEIVVAGEQVEQVLLDVDRTERGYLAAKDPSLLAAWQAHRDRLVDGCVRLERLVRTSSQADLARRITRDARSYVQDHGAPVLEAARRGDQSASGAATLQEGERRVRELRAQLDALAVAARQTAADRQERTRAANTVAVRAVVLGTAGSLVVSGLIVGYLTRVIVRPVRRAAAMAGQIASGNLDTRLPDAGAGEVRQLTRAFNTMSDAVRRSVDELVRYGETQAALRRIALRVAGGAEGAEVLDSVATEIGRLIGSDGAHIVRYEGDGTATVVAAWGDPGVGMPVGRRLSLDGDSVTAKVHRTGRTARVDDYTDAVGPLAAHLRQRGVRGAVGAPIVVEGRLWGVATASVVREEPLADDAGARLAEYADLIATTVANAQARADLAASRARVVIAADQARRQIERNLHDGVQQQLIMAAIDVADIEADVPGELPYLRQRLSEVTHRLTGVLEDLREISRGIHPAILSDSGLRSAFKTMARRSRIPVELDVHFRDRLPEPVEVAAYFVAAEALANAAKHARASYVRIEAELRDDWLHLSVHDDGVGGADPARGSGLTGLTDRVHALGGRLTVESPPGRGTRLRAELPLDLAARVEAAAH